MTFEIRLAFVAAPAAVLAIPGPTILLVIGQSRGAGVATAAMRRL
jgi:threonine/homoserine/homoserine lactone efflux protein